MKGSLKIWMVILGMVVIGVGITFLTNSYVSRQIEKMAETSEIRKAEAEIVQEDAVVSDREEAARNDSLNIAAAQDAGMSEITAGSGRSAEFSAGNGRSAEFSAESGGSAEFSAESGGSSAGIAEEAEVLTGQAAIVSSDKSTEKREYTEMEADESVSGKSADERLAKEGADEIFAETAAEAAPAAMQGEELANTPKLLSENAAVPEITEYSSSLQEELHEYQERFPQLDSQIEQMRKSETENNMYSVKNSAQTERRIWERELDGIYRLLCDSLDETAAQELKKEQQEWQQVRDSRAEEAAKKNSGGSLESVDYIASVAASNRERAYALLEKYIEE